MESHASAARPHLPARTLAGLRGVARRLHTRPDAAVSLAVAVPLAASAFIANGGLQLGPSTFVEVATIVIAGVLAASALLLVGLQTRLHGGLALASLVTLAGLTALSILWSLYPSDSWLETNRTLAYVGAFVCGLAAVRLARGHWTGVVAGVLLALSAISLYGLATKVAPAWLAPDETYARLREPYGYWNAVGVTAAMGMPLSLWLGTRREGNRLVTALAWPLLGLLAVTMLLSFSRGSIVAAVAGLALWLVLVPLRLRALAALIPSALAGAAVTAWAFGQGALTDDRVSLADRKDAGIELGLILAAMTIVLFLAGVGYQSLAERRPLGDRSRRRIGMAAIATLAVSPLLALGALTFTDRGVGGTISDRWHDLTRAEAVTPQNRPGRLVETASVRSIYWKRAVDVWEKHRLAGAGAGTFAQAQLRFREEEARARHAHGYVLQTLADLGLVGLGVSLLAFAAWALAVRETLALRRGSVWSGDWSRERIGLVALASVAVVFGVHSALDWTWFVPAVAITGLFCAGWLAGRGPLSPAERPGQEPTLEQTAPAVPSGPLLRRRLALALAPVAVAALGAVAVVQPWRAHERGQEALQLSSERAHPEARTAAFEAAEINPLSPEPYFDLAAVEDAGGNRRGALQALQRAVQLEPASPEAWRRLGDYYLGPLSNPGSALPALRAALFLDPLSAESRASFVAALRARGAALARAREAGSRTPTGRVTPKRR